MASDNVVVVGAEAVPVPVTTTCSNPGAVVVAGEWTMVVEEFEDPPPCIVFLNLITPSQKRWSRINRIARVLLNGLMNIGCSELSS